jgi:hypothetical protein
MSSVVFSRPDIVIEWLALTLRIRKFTGSNLCRIPAALTEAFRAFSQTLQEIPG